MQKTTHKNNLIKQPVIWGMIAGISLLSVYFLILTIANSFSHSIEQFKEMWQWITVLVLGFSIQAGLFTYIRKVMKLRKESGTATSSMAAAGGISTTSMVACCGRKKHGNHSKEECKEHQPDSDELATEEKTAKKSHSCCG